MWTKKFQMYSLDLEKAEEARDQIVDICWIIKKAREFQETIYFCFINYAKSFDCVYHNELWEILNRWDYQTILAASWKTYMQVKK